MARKSKTIDPYATREAEKYERPVPSREFVLDYLHESVGPLTLDEICSGLNLVDDEQIEAMRRRLRAMERDGQIARNRADGYGTLNKLNLVKGRVIGHPEGYGFVAPLLGGEQDIYLSSRQMRRVFDGDIVLVRIAVWIAVAAQRGPWLTSLSAGPRSLSDATFARAASIFYVQTIPVLAKIS